MPELEDLAHKPKPGGPGMRWLMTFAMYALVLLQQVRPVADPSFDPDIWWHLRVGQWVVEHRAVPEMDPFSQYGQTQRWVAYSWLYEVIVFGAYEGFGLYGILLYRLVGGLAVVFAIHMLVRRLEPRFLVATALTGLATLSILPILYERPWLFTIAFTAVTLHAVLELRLAGDRTPRRWVWALPIVYIVWANTHIQFLYGIVVLGLGCVAPLIDRDMEVRRWRQLLYLSVACVLATLVNPYHARLYGVIIEYISYPGAFRWIDELKACAFRSPVDFIMPGLVLLASYFLARRRLTAFDVLLLVGPTFLALRVRRDVWFAVLAAVAILATTGRGDEAPEEERDQATVWFFVPLLPALLGLAFVIGWLRGLTPENLNAAVERRFPVKAVDFIKTKGYSGPLFNDFNWGGYLIWALPDLPVSVDGRTNLHGDDRLERFGQTWAGMPGWEKDPDLEAANVVLALEESPLASLLLLDSLRYTQVYQDRVARVFVRKR